MIFTTTVNGFEVHAEYADDVIEEIFTPLLKKLTSLYHEKKKRIIVFLAAPPASGKSTLVLLLEQLSTQIEGIEDLQAVGMDGFHFHQDYILSHSIVRTGKTIDMKQVKGCPETFDFEKLYNKILTLKEKDTMWPMYNRKLHDVEEDQLHITKNIVLIEGNYLLLKEAPWNELSNLCDYAIYLDADENLLKERLIKRKMMGGTLPHKAIQFYNESDRVNVIRTLQYSKKGDLNLEVMRNGRIKKKS